MPESQVSRVLVVGGGIAGGVLSLALALVFIGAASAAVARCGIC